MYLSDKELKDLIKSVPNAGWRKSFTEDEWFRVVSGLYKEFRKFSDIDLAFDMYYRTGVSKFLMGDGADILRQRFLC